MSTSESPQVKAIRARYKLSLVDKAARITTQILALADSPSKTELEALHEELHKLAGSSGMYGYDDIALSAQAALRSIQDSPQADIESRLVELRDLLEHHA